MKLNFNKILIVLFILNFALIESMAQKQDDHKRKSDQISNSDAKADTDINPQPRKKARTQEALNAEKLGSDINAKKEEMSNYFVNFLETHNLINCLKLLQSFSSDSKKLLHHAIIKKYEQQLKSVIRPGLSSFISGSTAKSISIGDEPEYVTNNEVGFNLSSTQAITGADWNDGYITNLWDTANGKKLWEFQNGSSHESVNAFSPSDKYILTNKDKIAVLLNEKKDVIKEFDFKEEPTDEESQENKDICYISLAAFSPCEKYVTTVTKDANDERFNAIIWDIKTGNPKHILIKGGAIPIQSIAFSPNRKYLAIASNGKEGISIWDVDTGLKKIDLNCPVGRIIEFVIFSPDSKYLASLNKNCSDPEEVLSWAKEVAFWNVENAQCKKSLFFTSSNTNTIDYSPDGQFLAIGGNNIKFYDANNYKLLKTYNSLGSIAKIKFNKDGTQLIMGFEASNVSYTGEHSAKILNFSDCWFTPELDINQLILIVKLILNLDEFRNLTQKEIEDIFYSQPPHIRQELTRFLLHNVIHNKITRDPYNLTLEYLDSDLDYREEV